MIDFPASPTLNQQFTAAGVTWVWDGTKWIASGLSVAYLPLSGGTLSGSLTVATPGVGNSANLYLNKNSVPVNAQIIGQMAGSLRWSMQLGDSSAETGSNAGSNFSIYSFSDAGGTLSTPLGINRASGLVTIPNLSAPGVIGDNRIINGDMRIDQRNNGVGGTAQNVYTVDRWQYVAGQPAKGSWQRVASAAGLAGGGFGYYLAFQSSSAYASLAGDSFFFNQAIEADMITDFFWGQSNAQPVTLSFWVLSSLTGTFSGAIVNQPAPPTRSYPFTFTLPTANNWTKITVTIPGDTAGTWVMSGNAGGLAVRFDLGSGATFRGTANAWASGNYNGSNGTVSVVAFNAATFQITGVKLEIGSVATPYNRQSTAKSLADCQRYYQIGTLYLGCQAGTAGQSLQYGYGAPVVMRVNPTMVSTLNNSVNWTLASLNYNVNNMLYCTGTAIAAGATVINVNFTASAEL